MAVLDQLQRGGSQHGRHGEEEAELGGGAAFDAQRQGPQDGCARAADARDHRQALDEADADHTPERDFGNAMDVGLLHSPLDADDGQPAHDEGDADRQWRFEQRLDLLEQKDADDGRWKKGDQDVAHETDRYRIDPHQADGDCPECPPVKHDHRQDRAQLNDDIEHPPMLGIIAEQRTGEDQMAGRGNRDELGDALDNAEDEDAEQIHGGGDPVC